jgi:hypothetical protein
MSAMGLMRVIGVGVILLIGVYGGLLSAAGGLDVLILFQVFNTALLFVIMTIAYEWSNRRVA